MFLLGNKNKKKSYCLLTVQLHLWLLDWTSGSRTRCEKHRSDALCREPVSHLSQAGMAPYWQSGSQCKCAINIVFSLSARLGVSWIWQSLNETLLWSLEANYWTDLLNYISLAVGTLQFQPLLFEPSIWFCQDSFTAQFSKANYSERLCKWHKEQQ